MRGVPAPTPSARTGRRAALIAATLAALLDSPAMAAEPKPSPQRFIPAREIIGYIEFDGLAAHANAWEATAAYAMLAKTPAGGMMTEVARQVADRLLKMVPGGKLTGTDVIALQDHLVHHGFAIALHRHRDDVDSWTVVLNRLGRKGPRERFDRLVAALRHAPTPPAQLPKPTRLRGRDIDQAVHREEPSPAGDPLGLGLPAAAPNPPSTPIPWLSWWFEADDLVVTWVSFSTFELMQEPTRSKPLADLHAGHLTAILDVVEGKHPNVTTHPAYTAAMSEGADIKGFESDGLFFIDPGRKGGLFSGLLESPPAIKIPGLFPGPLTEGTGAGIADPISAVPNPAAPGGADVGSAPISPSSSGIPNPYGPPGTSGAPAAPTAPLPAPAAPPPAPGGVEELPELPTVVELPELLTFGPPLAIAGAAPDLVPPGQPPKAVRPPGPEPKPRPEAGDPRLAEKKPVDPSAALGLDGVKRIVGRWGFQGKALLTDVRIVAPGPRKGLVGWLDQPAFDKNDLPPIPRSAGSFAVDSFDPAAAYGRFAELAKAVEPELGGLLDHFERAAREATGLRLREDLLSHVGPTWCVLEIPSAAGADGGKGELDPTDCALVISLRDPDGFRKALDTLAARANQYLRDRDKADDPAVPANQTPDPPMLALERLPAPDRGYRLTSPSRLVFWLNDHVQPTILVGESYAAFAMDLERARRALAIGPGGGGRWRPTGELARSFECLPANLTFLAIGDDRDSGVPELIADLPGSVQLLSLGLSDLDHAEAGMSADLLSLAGIPRAGGFRLRIDPARIPRAEELQSYLFPSVLAASIDDAGLRLIAREAFPFACAGQGTYLRSSVQWSGAKGLKRDVKLGWKWGSAK